MILTLIQQAQATLGGQRGRLGLLEARVDRCPERGHAEVGAELVTQDSILKERVVARVQTDKPLPRESSSRNRCSTYCKCEKAPVTSR